MGDTSTGGAAPPPPGAGPGLLDAAVARLLRESAAGVGMVYVLPPDGTVLRLVVLSGIPLRIAVPWTRVPLSSPIPVADAVRERRLVWLGSREDMARRYPRPALVLPYDFALAAAPVTTGQVVWGGVVLLWSGEHPPHLAPHEREALENGCRAVGLLLHRAAQHGRPLLPGDAPRVLAQPGRPAPGPEEGAAAVSFADRLPGGSLALDLEGRITFATAAAAGLLGSRAEDLIGALAPEALPWLDDPVFEDHYREALISGRPTAFAAVRPPDHRLSFRLYPDHTGVSVRVEAAPAAAGGEGGGRPAPPSRGPGRATALYQLMHLAATLAEAAGVRDVVDQAADQIMPAFGVRALALATVLDGRLRVVGHRGVPPDVLARFDGVPLGSPSPVARVLDTGQAGFYATFAELREDYPDVVRPRGMSAWAFLPLTASDHVLGALVLGYDRPRRFPPEERAFLISLAGLVAQALDRALLYDARDRLARSLQSALLPHVLPDVPGLRVAARYVPALRGMGIGGDFYDVIRLGGAAAAAIGDVQGHNVTAAALMGQVRTAVHATAGAPPGEVLARVNRLVTDLNPGLFTSCLYAHLDLDRHRVRLATAGHPPPLLRHPGGHAEVLDLTPGLLLGIDRDAEYPTTEIALPPGAVLALYTDGLVEAPGGDIGDAIAGLAGRLSGGGGPSPDTLDGLAATLLEHARASVPGGDDMALLLLGPAGHPIGPGTA